ncbi:response regulator [Microbacterium telephonicum]|uniref:Two-component system CitB family response regulator n=1 Tax=Microbacterium telephonicum TaxID=1714841 RepID=A0A498BZM5_9MICO|nr:response regulator [Microbacterium telephonicum]RLK48912.1 two-component system CitB family response regulator [Microbacterium telephonicum]
MTEPIRVLVVDDDFRVAGLHRDVVDAHPGFVALTPARTLHDAAATIRAEKPQLLLIDVHLPDGDGIAFLADHDVDGFVLSAETSSAAVRRALRAGALGYLVKPFDRRALVDRLDRYLRHRNLVAPASLSQGDIDRALAALHGGVDGGSLSRGATEQLILDALGADEASATEIAERTGISRATAQRHLSALAQRGGIRVRLQYGTTGRPEHRYAATATPPGAAGRDRADR